MTIRKNKTILMPGNDGKDCLGNGSFNDAEGVLIECWCDECDYLMCCTRFKQTECSICTNKGCPRLTK